MMQQLCNNFYFNLFSSNNCSNKLKVIPNAHFKYSNLWLVLKSIKAIWLVEIAKISPLVWKHIAIPWPRLLSGKLVWISFPEIMTDIKNWIDTHKICMDKFSRNRSENWNFGKIFGLVCQDLPIRAYFELIKWIILNPKLALEKFFAIKLMFWTRFLIGWQVSIDAFSL